MRRYYSRPSTRPAVANPSRKPSSTRSRRLASHPSSRRLPTRPACGCSRSWRPNRRGSRACATSLHPSASPSRRSRTTSRSWSRPDSWHARSAARGRSIHLCRERSTLWPPEWLDWDRDHAPEHRWVATDGDDDVVGWVGAQRTSARQVYTGVLETSIYVAGRAQRVGVGGTLQTGIFPENAASLALHERFGFRRLGIRERVGKRDGRWRDVVLLERRSSVVGS